MTRIRAAGLRGTIAAVILALAACAHADTADRATLSAAFRQAGLDSATAAAKARLVDQITDLVASSYVEPRDPHALVVAAAAAIAAQPQGSPVPAVLKAGTDAITARLDPHTAYLSPEEWADMKTVVDGSFSGVGMELAADTVGVRVITALDGSPAAKAGISPGERVVAVDGQSVDGLSLAQVVALIRGPRGKPVALTLVKEPAPPRVVTVIRDTIALHPVSGRLDGDIAIVRLSQFVGGAADMLKNSLTTLDSQAAFGVKAIVLDLRRNPGGLLDQAVEAADLFLDDQTIVTTRDRKNGDGQTLRGRRGQVLPGRPMVVLIDGGSASAAEILAGALHDDGRAVLVGQKSYGKGSVQSLLRLAEGGMRLTIARYFRPSGQAVDGIGITPDAVVANGETGDAQLDRALALLRAALAPTTPRR